MAGGKPEIRRVSRTALARRREPRDARCAQHGAAWRLLPQPPLAVVLPFSIPGWSAGREAGRDSASQKTLLQRLRRPSHQARQQQPDLTELEILHTFNELDTRGDNVLDDDEIRVALKRLNLPCSDDYLRDLFDDADWEWGPSKRVSRDEFVGFVKSKESAMRRAFNKIDKKGDGHICAEEAADFLRAIGIRANLEDGQQMVEHLDTQGNRKVTYEEFRAFAVLLPRAQLRHNVGWAWVESATDDVRLYCPMSDPLKQFLAGGLAGALSRTCIAPADRAMSIIMSGASGSTTNPITVLRQVVLDEGFGGLWRGNWASVVKKFPQKAIEFGVYDALMRLVSAMDKKKIMKNSKLDKQRGGDSSGSNRMLTSLIVGAAAGAAGQTLLHVLDVVKTQQNVGQSGSFGQVLLNLVRTEGIRGMYRGYLPSLIETLAGTGIGFCLYDSAKLAWKKWKHRQPTSVELAILGGLTSAATLTVCMPLNVVTKRMVAQGMKGVPKYSSIADCVLSTLRTEGIKGFFRGLLVSYVKIVPSIALTYSLYEAVRSNWGVGGIRKYRRNAATAAAATAGSVVRGNGFMQNCSLPQRKRARCIVAF
ncbi:Calcium-binding mitochondrial carrier protein SCaMC-1 [Porphyridium purpureum]|uniref:Calcium-binding mitochondrial carrier protein SCaMC-1 n=1 Tax=Porphyridium purpureum TaxID=35688 RepID=A0A5J4Z617_PORPP|nr:Calcium-binding mitochondrial carrier protein SCaMC-1 [Porphyridium purpureum]|eukprot:POR3718..scf295_1